MALDGAHFGPTPQYAPVRPRRRSKFRFLTYPFRFSFRLFKRSIAGVIRMLAFHPVSSLLVVLLAGAVAFLGYQDYSGGRLRLGGGAGSGINDSLPPSPAAE